MENIKSALIEKQKRRVQIFDTLNFHYRECREIRAGKYVRMQTYDKVMYSGRGDFFPCARLFFPTFRAEARKSFICSMKVSLKGIKFLI